MVSILSVRRAGGLILAAVLIARWPDGSITRDPSTTLDAYFEAARAWTAGRGLPLNALGPALSVTCVPSSDRGAGFKPGWDKIKGFNG